MMTANQMTKDPTVDATAFSTIDVPENASDYGDFGNDADEIEILELLLAQVESKENEERHTLLRVTDIEDYEPPNGFLLPKDPDLNALRQSAQIEIRTENQILRRNIAIESVDVQKGPSRDRDGEQPQQPSKNSGSEDQSPLERFRKPPKKALSVTDLVSPAWCELQYYYTLSKHGRKRRTSAMKQGSAVHRALEDEVYVTVPVETTKPEDGWGLRIWNICQGLKTLRETGCTRELEIWGTIGGELVNGIIDELSYDCPDSSYEDESKRKDASIVELPEYQASITEYLLARPDKEEALQGIADGSRDRKWIYITDIKTRATPTLPTGASTRPTIVQLHLYHHMLENLVQGNFSLRSLTDRYNLDMNERFSDSFLIQLVTIYQETFPDSSQAFEEHILTGTSMSQDPVDVLLKYTTLASLWDFMMLQFRETFLLNEPPLSQLDETTLPPASQQSTSDLLPPPPQPTRLSPLLTATYLAANYKHTPSKINRQGVLGRKSFQFDPTFLHSYLSESLSWWRGEREAKGVPLQEAWKCRSCDFRNDCVWILERDQAAFDEAMRRKKAREIASLEGKEEEIVRSRV